MKRNVLIAAGLTLIGTITIALVVSAPPDVAEREAVPELATHKDVGTAVAQERDASVVESWRVVEPAPGDFVALVDGAPVEAQFTIGAAGLYPPIQAQNTSVALPAPSLTMSGESIDVVEVYARSVDGTRAFWGDVQVEANAVELSAAETAEVLVTGPLGRPKPGVEVRLGRETVGLVVLHQTTDEAGVAAFGALPAGEYVASAALPASPTVEVVAGTRVSIIEEPGRPVVGTVRGVDGTVISGATVAVHGAAFGVAVGSELPVEIVATDTAGRFRVERVPGTQFAAVVAADGWEPGSATAVPELADKVTIDVTLRRGRAVTVRVLDERGNPVSGATVRWSDPKTQMGAARLTDSTGTVKLTALPTSARLFANHGTFESPAVDLASVASPSVQLTLRNTDARAWRYRVKMPPEIPLLDLEAHDGSGARCGVTTENGRDFTLTSCGEGAATLSVITPLGVAQVDAGAFKDGATVDVPAPQPVELRVTGALPGEWPGIQVALVGTQASIPPMQESVEGDAKVLSARLYPGRWTLKVANVRLGSLSFAVIVEDEPFDATFELVPRQTFSIEVVDAYGAAITGAYALLFADGKLVDVARTGGQLPTEFRVRPPFNGELLVVDSRRGEGRVRLETSGDTNKKRVALRSEVLSLKVPASRPSRDELAARLGVELVRQDEGAQLDVKPGSKAEQAGLRRGDRIVSAWSEGQALRVVVYRSGKGYVDTVVN